MTTVRLNKSSTNNFVKNRTSLQVGGGLEELMCENFSAGGMEELRCENFSAGGGGGGGGWKN